MMSQGELFQLQQQDMMHVAAEHSAHQVRLAFLLLLDGGSSAMIDPFGAHSDGMNREEQV